MINFEKYPLPKRMRHHIAPNVYFPASELTIIPDYYPPLIETVDWAEHFANALPPTILDIGCGRGRFLFDLSFQLTDENLLGIEVRPAPAGWIREVVLAEGLSNISVLLYSVVNGMSFIADNSIKKVFYLFPDPWPKKRHQKRRAFNQNFLKEVYRVLDVGGQLNLATDLLEVHDYHKELLAEFFNFEVNEIISDDDWQYPITNKEDFCRKKNIEFYRLTCIKR